MPIKIVQSNHRVAEVQFICDICGQPIHTALIPKEDVEAHTVIKLTCYNCKKTK